MYALFKFEKKAFLQLMIHTKDTKKKFFFDFNSEKVELGDSVFNVYFNKIELLETNK